ncbi:MAG: AAA family ATPase [Flammeovirgaceae bacterium]
MAKILSYTGSALQKKQHFYSEKYQTNRKIDAYIPALELIDAVNLAIQLNRPLLLMGAPGCGKTRLAEAVAYELHGDKMDDYFFKWYVKSGTKAKDGIYQYDALRRLYDVNMKLEADKAKISDIKNYITKGELAKAFITPQRKPNVPNILLIDEIDKADIDFPNDLLLELEEKKFVIPELGAEQFHLAKSNVLIFITSNQEKELPPAFLRRCLFHYIEFPSPDKLTQIVSNHFEKSAESEQLIKKAIELFHDLRDQLDASTKKPATSELIDWFKLINFYRKLKAEKPAEKDRTAEEHRLIQQVDLLEKGKIPFKQVLLKTLDAKHQHAQHES